LNGRRCRGVAIVCGKEPCGIRVKNSSVRGITEDELPIEIVHGPAPVDESACDRLPCVVVVLGDRIVEAAVPAEERKDRTWGDFHVEGEGPFAERPVEIRAGNQAIDLLDIRFADVADEGAGIAPS